MKPNPCPENFVENVDIGLQMLKNAERQQGDKKDTGKPQMDLISPIALTFLAEVLTFGAKKYASHNWRKGISISKLIAASQRHLTAIEAGEDYDQETGLPHAAHLMCECMFMCEFLTRSDYDILDDRYKLEQNQKDLLVALLAGDVKKVSMLMETIQSQ